MKNLPRNDANIVYELPTVNVPFDGSTASTLEDDGNVSTVELHTGDLLPNSSNGQDDDDRLE